MFVCSLPASAEGPDLESGPGVRLGLALPDGGADLLGSAEGKRAEPSGAEMLVGTRRLRTEPVNGSSFW